MLHRFLLCIAMLCGVAKPSLAWWDSGHMVVAQIAYDRLKFPLRNRLDGLARRGVGIENRDFVTAACWADDLKGQGVRFYDTWHYTDTPLYDGVYSASKPEGNLLWAMSECQRLLQPRLPDPRRPGETPVPVSLDEQARALRFFVHFVGDVHMPLHAATRYALETPKGDRGGNDFKVGDENLHAFWDSGAGLFTERLERPLTGEGRAKIRELARKATQAFPEAEVPEAKNLDFSVWADESFDIARNEVYRTPLGQKPTPEYAQRAQTISLRRLALAGYRLAACLDVIYAAK